MSKYGVRRALSASTPDQFCSGILCQDNRPDTLATGATGLSEARIVFNGNFVVMTVDLESCWTISDVGNITHCSFAHLATGEAPLTGLCRVYQKWHYAEALFISFLASTIDAIISS